MKKKNLNICVLTLCLVVLIGCQNKLTIKVNKTIEYGQEYQIDKVFKVSEKGTEIKTNITIDTSLVGNYEIQVTAKNKDETIEEKKQIKVEDTKGPELNVLQDINEIYELPLHSEFNIVGNMESSQDSVDGAISTIEVLDNEQFINLEKTVAENHKKLIDRMFKTSEEIEQAKQMSREKSMYIAITSAVDAEKAGEYEIKAMAIDSNFNRTNIEYKVKVLEEGKAVQEGKLAAGAKDGPFGTLANEFVSAIAKREENGNEQVAPVVKSVGEKVDVNQYKNTSTITTANPIVQAAKKRVGQSLWCDELVTAALVEAGKISGGNSGLFDGVVGVYYFPSLGNFISQAQAVPGDLVYYDDGGLGVPHIAVYAGNGMAIHGGFSGGHVVVYSVNIGTGPKYLRLPNHLTWDEINEIVFGFTIEDPKETPPNIPPQPAVPPVTRPTPPLEEELPDIDEGEVITTYYASYGNEEVSVEGKNMVVSVVEGIVWQYFEGTIDKATMESKLKAQGFTVTYG